MYVVSHVEVDNGEPTDVSQYVSLHWEADGSPILGYVDGDKPLTTGRRYALIVSDDPAAGSGILVLRGHAYLLDAGNKLQPTFDLEETRELSGVSLEELRRRLAAAKQ